jgi:hypothetical protein
MEQLSSEVKERLDNVKACVEESSQLQYACLEKIDLSKIKKPVDLARAKFNYDSCLSSNIGSYPCLNKRSSLI